MTGHHPALPSLKELARSELFFFSTMGLEPKWELIGSDPRTNYIEYTESDVKFALDLWRSKQSKESPMTYRQLHQDVTDPSFVEELGDVKAVQVYQAMCSARISGTARVEVMNRLFNMKHSDRAVEITADRLVRNGFERMAEITIPGMDLAGHIQNAGWVHHQGEMWVSVTIRLRDAINSSYLVNKDELVRVWPVEYRDPSPALQAADMRPRTLPPIRPGQNPFLQPQCTHTRDGVKCALNKGHNNGRAGGHVFPIAKQPLLTGYTRPQTRPRDATKYVEAYLLWDFRKEYLGKQVSVKNQATGALTDITCDNNGKVLLVVNGQLHKLNRNAMVVVNPTLTHRCAEPMGDHPIFGTPIACQLDRGHSERHLFQEHTFNRTKEN